MIYIKKRTFLMINTRKESLCEMMMSEHATRVFRIVCTESLVYASDQMDRRCMSAR